MKKHSNAFLPFIFKTTLPVLFGYITLGAAYGLLMSTTDYPLILVPLIGLFVYAGSLQFITVSLFASNAGLFEIASISLLLNSRHIVYGLSFLSKYNISKWYKPYLIFSLTDETYGLLTTIKIPDHIDKSKAYLYISAFNHFYWILGSTIGVLFGNLIEFNMAGLDFSLTALFIVLLIEQLKNSTARSPFFLAALCGFLILNTAGKNNMLLISIGLSTAILILFRRVLIKNES